MRNSFPLNARGYIFHNCTRKAQKAQGDSLTVQLQLVKIPLVCYKTLPMERNKLVHVYLTRRDKRMSERGETTDKKTIREIAHVYVKRIEHQPVHVYFQRSKAAHVYTGHNEHAPLHVFIMRKKHDASQPVHVYLKRKKTDSEQAA
jgi:hypothetical protein